MLLLYIFQLPHNNFRTLRYIPNRSPSRVPKNNPVYLPDHTVYISLFPCPPTLISELFTKYQYQNTACLLTY